MSKYIEHYVFLTQSEADILIRMKKNLKDEFNETFNDRMLRLIKSGNENYTANGEIDQEQILTKIPIPKRRYDLMRKDEKFNSKFIQSLVKEILERYNQFLEYGEMRI